ncbi:hypothetical protein FDA94_13590 [Herbidospora galbida]|uniref:Enoyl reductase n=1 Tax=Herbidospora galbida TaxID=2575442 RepID=A0A4U3MGB5_9ACTN|nr:hypothetical protein [Herbidospora galbida]TKK88335.1 hypothetical protein FDA94_13590 [Herbidospora galbida]
MKAALALTLALNLVAAPTPGGAHGKGFQTGRTVGVQLTNSNIIISGNGTNGRADGYRIKRPCWYEPGKSAEDMLQSQEQLRSWWFHTNPGGTEEDFQKFLEQYKDKVGEDGRWWSPAYNAADPGGMACWSALEGALWVPEGETPAGGITMEELLQIARAALTVPEPTIQLNPDAKSFVNLPTWVWLGDQGATTRSVTATLPGVMSATVTATLDSIKIDPGTGSDRAEVKQNCGPNGHAYVKGGTFTCGVRYLRASADQPRKVYTLTVTTVWPVTSNVDQSVVPFVYDPVEATVTRDVPVGEVQTSVEG